MKEREGRKRNERSEKREEIISVVVILKEGEGESAAREKLKPMGKSIGSTRGRG